MRKHILFLSCAVLAIPALSAVAEEPTTEPEIKTLLEDAQKHFRPLPAVPAARSERVELGRRLFFEPRVSADGKVSCAHCHQPALYGADGLAKSKGVFGRANARNAPTVFNAALQFKQHWRGDRESLEDQAQQSLLGPASFGNPDYAAAMAKLAAIAGYRDLFAKAFPGENNPITVENWANAIGAFERSLLTPSKFDAFLTGNANALAAAERTGLRKFMDVGCVECHSGAGVGGETFEKFGVIEDYWKETGGAEPDKGRFDVTKQDADLYVFKVSSLRNVAKTAPYFH
ncbi:MAG: cytochrome-c peroxidase, partial [Methylocystis sp.]|nr:cytochrome-c peroxidase [Methylocystis sp.]